MAAVSGLSWADTRGYLQALDTLLATTPDTDALVAWRSAKVELAAALDASASSAKRLLGDLQGACARAEASASELALPLEELRVRIEQVEVSRAAVTDRVQRMASTRDASAASMAALLQSTLDLKDEQRRLEAMKRSASPHLQCVGGDGEGRGGAEWGWLGVCTCAHGIDARFTPAPPPTHRHQLALYFNVTGVRWNYESEAVEGCAWRRVVWRCRGLGHHTSTLVHATLVHARSHSLSPYPLSLAPHSHFARRRPAAARALHKPRGAASLRKPISGPC